MQSVVETIKDASNRLVEDNTNFDGIYRALINKGQTPEQQDRSTYVQCVNNLNIAGDFQNKEITPSSEDIEVVADDDYIGLSKVTVKGDENLIAANIKAGVTLFGIVGTYTGN